MDYQEKRILEHIRRWHTSKARATTYKKLAADLGMDTRELRSVVARLVTEHGALIATTSNLGYYWIENFDDYKHARGELTERIKKLRARLDGLESGWEKARGPQRSLFEAEV